MYKITFESSAEKFLNKLEDIHKERIIKKLEKLSENPRLGKPLVGNLSGLWSLRIEKYRVIYKIIDDKLIVIILNIGHRKNVYG